MTESDKAIAAGLIMGEGAISLCNRKGHAPRLTIAVEMCDRKSIEWLRNRWAGHTFCRKRNRGKYNRRTFIWTIQHKKAVGFLQDILPYVVGEKLPQICLMLEVESKRGVPSKRLSPEQHFWFEDMRNELKRLKHIEHDAIEKGVDPRVS